MAEISGVHTLEVMGGQGRGEGKGEGRRGKRGGKRREGWEGGVELVLGKMVVLIVF